MTDTTTEPPGAPVSDETPPVEESPADAVEAAQEAQEAVRDDTETDGREQLEESDQSDRGEAKQRKRAQAAEAERDQLAGQVEALQRQLVDGIVESQVRIKPQAFWASGATVADLLDDNGAIDPARVVAAGEAAASNLGLARPMKPNRSQGRSSGDSEPDAGQRWTDAFKR